MAKAREKSKIQAVEIKGGPHNGEGRPDLWFKDPVNGEMIGGQRAAIRMSMRFRHVVTPWARRQGKSRMYQFLFVNEATVTSGKYYGGLVYPDHTVAAKVADGFRESWGALVKDYKINDKDQDRWVELHPCVPPPGAPPPTWFTPKLVEKWKRCQNEAPNLGARIYFWGAQMPHASKIQGFIWPYQRICFDETQETEPVVHQIVRPMLRDVRGSENFSGTPWSKGIGNVQFEKYWDLAGNKAIPGWFRMRVPDGTNPHVPPTPLEEARLSMTESEIRQTMFAEFLSDAGAVFSNLDRVFVLKALKDDDPNVNWARALRSKYGMPSMSWWISEPEPIPGHVYGVSIDWARSPKGDYSALHVFDFATGHQCCLMRWRGEDFTQQMEVVLAVAAHYGASQLHSDSNGMGESMSDFMRRRHAVGFVGHKFGRNKADFVRRGQILFRDESVALIDCAEQKQEFKNFSAFEADGLGSEKQIKYCAPEGEHDDFVASFIQLAPTLTIVGRQELAPPEPAKPPIVDETGLTTLEAWGEGLPVPPTREDGLAADLDWQSVVLPRSSRPY